MELSFGKFINFLQPYKRLYNLSDSSPDEVKAENLYKFKNKQFIKYVKDTRDFSHERFKV